MSVDSMYGCLTVSYDKMSSMFFLYGVINYVARWQPNLSIMSVIY